MDALVTPAFTVRRAAYSQVRGAPGIWPSGCRETKNRRRCRQSAAGYPEPDGKGKWGMALTDFKLTCKYMSVESPIAMPPLRFLSLAAIGLIAVSPMPLSAQSVSTTPVGAVTVTIAAGTGTTRTLSVISFPLLQNGSVDGQMTGRLTAIGSNTFSNGDAGWTAGQLSQAASPYLIQITSGVAAGRTFLLSTSTTNTSTQVTIDGEEASLVDLTSLGIAVGVSGDTYRLIEADTLSSIFGTPEETGVLGNTSSTTADVIYVLVSGLWRSYYYNTTSGAWLRVGPNVNSNNVPIRPDALILYSRIAADSITLSLVGSVPNKGRQAIVRNSGLSAMSTSWPVDIMLGDSGIQNIPGWVTSADPSTADIVNISVSGLWRAYYHNGTQWLRVGPNSPSNAVVISAGSGFLLVRKGTATGSVQLEQSLPYSL